MKSNTASNFYWQVARRRAEVVFYDGKLFRTSSMRWKNGPAAGYARLPTSLKLYNEPRKIVVGPVILCYLGV